MLESVREQLTHATTAHRPASTCFLLNQKQPPQPPCIWMATTGSRLRLLPKTSTGAVTSSLPPSLSHSSSHTHTLALSPSLLHSLCLFPLVSSDWRAPQTVFTPPQALRHRHAAAGLRPSTLFMNQVQPKYVSATDRWPACIVAQRKPQKKKKKEGDAYLAPAPINTPSSIWVVDRFLPRGAFLMCSSWESAALIWHMIIYENVNQ